MKPSNKIEMPALYSIDDVFKLFDSYFSSLNQYSLDNTTKKIIAPLEHVINVLKDAYRQGGIAESDLMFQISNLLEATISELENRNSNVQPDIHSSLIAVKQSFENFFKSQSEKIIIKITLPKDVTGKDLLSLKQVFGDKTIFLMATHHNIDEVIQNLDQLDTDVIVIPYRYKEYTPVVALELNDVESTPEKEQQKLARKVKILEEKVGNSIECEFKKNELGHLNVIGLCNNSTHRSIHHDDRNLDFSARGLINPVFEEAEDNSQPDSSAVKKIIEIIHHPEKYPHYNPCRHDNKPLDLKESYRSSLLTRFKFILQWAQTLEKLFPQRIPQRAHVSVDRKPTFTVDSGIASQIRSLFEIQMGMHVTIRTLNDSFKNSTSNVEAVKKVLRAVKAGEIGYTAYSSKQNELIEKLESILIKAQQIDGAQARNKNTSTSLNNNNNNSNMNDDVSSIRHLNSGNQGMFGSSGRKENEKPEHKSEHGFNPTSSDHFKSGKK